MKIEQHILELFTITLLGYFKGNEIILNDAFEENLQLNTPIKNIIEFGVAYPHFGGTVRDSGSSTKVFLTLCNYFDVNKFISVDIDPACMKTVEDCHEWVKSIGLKLTNHEFVCSNSIKFNFNKYFGDEKIDLILLDTNHDHTYPESHLGFPGSGGSGFTYRELNYLTPFLSKNGRFFLHDTLVDFIPKQYGHNVGGAITKFIDENKNFVFKEHGTLPCGFGEINRIDSDIYNRRKSS